MNAKWDRFLRAPKNFSVCHNKSRGSGTFFSCHKVEKIECCILSLTYFVIIVNRNVLSFRVVVLWSMIIAYCVRASKIAMPCQVQMVLGSWNTFCRNTKQLLRSLHITKSSSMGWNYDVFLLTNNDKHAIWGSKMAKPWHLFSKSIRRRWSLEWILIYWNLF